MASQKILGREDTVCTTVKYDHGDREAANVKIEGAYGDLERKRWSLIQTECPSGYTVETDSLESTGEGMGALTLRCVKYGASDGGSSFSASREVIRVDMAEVHYDLQNHPSLDKRARKIAIKWLATDIDERYNDETEKYYYTDKNGNKHEITSEVSEKALKFCKAQMSGITGFQRYYPVIELIGIWKNPPGLTQNGRSFKSGSPRFSEGAGRYNNPPISLNGYPNGHWFKSKDSWVQNSDSTWTRTEQWTYTPESSSGENGWVYNEL